MESNLKNVKSQAYFIKISNYSEEERGKDGLNKAGNRTGTG